PPFGRFVSIRWPRYAGSRRLSTHGGFGCIGLDRDSVSPVRRYVVLRKTAEILAIVFAELRMTLISDPDACLTNVKVIQEQAPPRLVKTDAPLILNWRDTGNGLKVLME